MPKTVWKACFYFENDKGEFDRVKDLYSRLIEKTSQVKVCRIFCNSHQSNSTPAQNKLLSQDQHVGR